MATGTVPEQRILQLKITLKDHSPSIWRKIVVSSNDTFEDLHCYIQKAMGWRTYHLHDFKVANVRIVQKYDDGEEHPIELMMGDDLDQTYKEHEVRLSQFLWNPKDSVIYTYDYGNNWLHKVVVEKILPTDSVSDIPKCISGKRACPPEDCGGVYGYKNLLEIYANPNHPEYQEMIQNWLFDCYPGFDPNKFEIPTLGGLGNGCSIS